MIFLPQRAPVERIFGVVRRLRNEDDVFVAAESML
jgi:hypothetical protein